MTWFITQPISAEDSDTPHAGTETSRLPDSHNPSPTTRDQATRTQIKVPCHRGRRLAREQASGVFRWDELASWPLPSGECRRGVAESLLRAGELLNPLIVCSGLVVLSSVDFEGA